MKCGSTTLFELIKSIQTKKDREYQTLYNNWLTEYCRENNAPVDFYPIPLTTIEQQLVNIFPSNSPISKFKGIISIRNPYDRLISFYNWIHASPAVRFLVEERMIDFIKDKHKIPKFIFEAKKIQTNQLSFEEFLSSPYFLNPDNFASFTQLSLDYMTMNSKHITDIKIITIENLYEDLAKLDYVFSERLWLNKIDYRHSSTKYDLVSRKNIDMINSVFKSDFEQGEYKMI